MSFIGPRRALMARRPLTSWPCPARGVVGHLDFRDGKLWSGSKGQISVAQAITTVRPDTVTTTAPQMDGRLAPFGPNVPRITDQGLSSRAGRTNIVKRNLDMTNASSWTLSNMAAENVLEWPFTVGGKLRRVILPPGTTSWTIPNSWDNTNNKVRCLGAGGNGSAGVAGSTRVSGAPGGSGGYAETSNVMLTPGATITGITIPTGGSGVDCKFPNESGVTQVLAKSAGNASGTTGGAGGSNTGAVGTLRRAGTAGSSGGSGAADRGGGGAPGAPGPDSAAAVASGANTSGGGGGSGPNATGTGNTVADANNGGRGGDNRLGAGHGVGATATTAATNGTLGGAGAGGRTGSFINGSNGSNEVVVLVDPFTLEEQTYDGSGGGGGGGGLGGNGGNGGNGAGGGAGGATLTLSGLGGLGGDGWIVITWGGAAATLLTALADDATISQTLSVSGVTNTRALSAMYYLKPGDTMTGRALMSQDGYVTTTDVTDLLIAGQWISEPGPVQTSDVDRVVGLKLTKAGDRVGCIAMQLESSDNISDPIPTQTASAERNDELITLNLENFPAFATDDKITVFVVCKPTVRPTPAPENLDGWNVFSLSSAFTTKFVGAGYIIDDVYYCTGVTSGSVEVGDRINVGTGVVFFTDIAEALTGTGGVGTYRVTVGGITLNQTTPGAPSPIAIVTRDKDFVQYVLNSDPKEAEDYQVRIGLTVRDEVHDEQTAWDPQKEFAPHNQRHALGFTITASGRYGITFLNGDYDESSQDANHFTFVPDVSRFSVVVIGTMGPDGVGNPLNGTIDQVVIVKGLWTAAMGARLTHQMKRAA